MSFPHRTGLASPSWRATLPALDVQPSRLTLTVQCYSTLSCLAECGASSNPCAIDGTDAHTQFEFRWLLDRSPSSRAMTRSSTCNRSVASSYWQVVAGFQENRAREKREMSWSVRSKTARSARISPITGANLKPCPEHGDATMTWGHPGSRSRMKSPSGVVV